MGAARPESRGQSRSTRSIIQRLFAREPAFAKGNAIFVSRRAREESRASSEASTSSIEISILDDRTCGRCIDAD